MKNEVSEVADKLELIIYGIAQENSKSTGRVIHPLRIFSKALAVCLENIANNFENESKDFFIEKASEARNLFKGI